MATHKFKGMPQPHTNLKRPYNGVSNQKLTAGIYNEERESEET